MIKDVWEKLSADRITDGYSFKEIGLPHPDAASMSKCRELCARNLCGAYGMTWGCPPGIGTEKECLRAIGNFSGAAVLIKKFDNVDLKDKKLIEKLGAAHQDVCRKFVNKLREERHNAMALADGGCRYCKKCSCPDEPCGFPDQMVPSISAYGIMMDEYMRSNNIDFEFEKDAMTLYGLILFSGAEVGK